MGMSEKQNLYGKISNMDNVKQGIFGIRGEKGKSLEYLWNGTSLGIKREDEEEYAFTELKGEKGDTGPIGATSLHKKIILEKRKLVYK